MSDCIRSHNVYYVLHCLILHVGGACCCHFLATWQDANGLFSCRVLADFDYRILDSTSGDFSTEFQSVARMSVRSRIEAFEALSSKDADNSNEPSTSEFELCRWFLKLAN